MSKISRRHFVEETGAGLVAATVSPPLKGQHGAAPLLPAAKIGAMMAGKGIAAEPAAQAGQAAVEGAQPLAKNKYKIPLTAAIVKRTLASLGSA